ncbi:hypothetical protein COD77_23165 [Bacillus cereus]|nr:hypothetical protein COD77_23165 [Bacillus cereus]
MVNKKRHMKVKLWSVRTLIILFFAISAITLSQGVVYVQDIVKERFFSKTKTISERNYDFTRVCLKTIVHCVNRKIVTIYTKAKKEYAS